jgi:hypothetical protein
MSSDVDAFLERTYHFPEDTWLNARSWLRRRLRQIAKSQDRTYYSDLCNEMRKKDVIELEPHGAPLAAILGQINVMEHDQDRPLLSAVVLSKDSNRPGVGFWNIATALGIRFGPSESEREMFWLESLQACYDYWKSRDANAKAVGDA